MPDPMVPLDVPVVPPDSATLGHLSPRLMPLLWRDWRVAALVATAAAMLAGLLVAGAMPRGPDTTGHALTLMAVGLIVGLIAGFVVRSRWVIVLAPIGFVVAFEVSRHGTDGPLVDSIHLDSSFGILALVLGRGVYMLIALLPMTLGVVYGRALARRIGQETVRQSRHRTFYARKAVAGLTTVGVIALAILIARPASVPPVLGADGQPIPGSIAELTEVNLGGHDQWISVRGASADKPVLLWLAGGPGQSDLAFTRVLFADLAQNFVVVDWDQRGAGKSHGSLDPTSTWTLEQAVSDTVELTNYLRTRFDEQKIYLAGESWGTTLGVLSVQAHPELYFASIASGQMVSELETDRQTYRDLIAFADSSGDQQLAKKLRGMGEPPFHDVFSYGLLMEHYEDLVPAYTSPATYRSLGNDSGIGPYGILASEYAFIDKINVLAGLLDMFSVMYPQLQGIDFRRDVPSLDVPVYLFQGQFEMASRDDFARSWFAQLQAPHKELFTIENAGHSAAYEGYQEFTRIMIEVVLPATYPGA